jgi:hypothetical protein
MNSRSASALRFSLGGRAFYNKPERDDSAQAHWYFSHRTAGILPAQLKKRQQDAGDTRM